MKPRRASLFWRLLLSYLLVIGVGSATFWLAGQSFAPYFLDRHVSDMVLTMHNLTPETVMAQMNQMTTDLARVYRVALNQSFLWAVLVSVVVAGMAALFVTRRIVLPLRDLRLASNRVAAGRYEERLDAHPPGELGDVVEAFNAMAETLEGSEARRVELLANVAHEFRTPLSSLHGYIEGLEDGLFQADAETLPACRRQVERLGRLVDDLALLSRVETGREEVRLEPLSVADLLCGTLAAFRPQFDKKGVVFDVTTPAPDLWVHADKERSGQVLTNLVGNALRHTPPGGVVALSARAQAREVAFEVNDTGEGIPEGSLPHVFTRFYRVDKARTHHAAGGSGIGLTIAKHYVERQGGRIGVSAVEGRGSSFWFTLPRTH